jgi:N-methylhydantoinase B/oxoprolinase/acetone carboxylase alpha subunit
MNNITWSDNKATSYYETVAGGVGAVRDFLIEVKKLWGFFL